MKKIYENSESRPGLKSFNETFLDDAVELFMGTRSGHVGKYIYEDYSPTQSFSEENDYLWKEVITQKNPSYYMPTADNELLLKALTDIRRYIPSNTSVVDFGIGGIAAFNAHIRPFLDQLSSPSYIGIDACADYLNAIKRLQPEMKETAIIPIEMDFFEPEKRCVSPYPALGIMTCGTIGNIYGTISDRNVNANLTRALKTLTTLTSHGWLLISVDTNQDEPSLMRGYDTPIMARLFLTALHRIFHELPCAGFDPHLFKYVPEWHPDIQLLAHTAEALEDQSFLIGPYALQVRKGQRIHLLNSYKFKKSFFESCCDRANLDVLHVWNHDSPSCLYLVKDRANRVKAPVPSLPAFASGNAGDAEFVEGGAQAANVARS